jgi:hypothetical protein
MRKILSVLLVCMTLGLPSFGSSHRATQSKKSTAPGCCEGTYRGGHGSSHKGGHYKNSRTADHYRKRN